MNQQILENSRKCTYPGIKPEMYLITEEGKIYSLLKNRFMAPNYDRDGYLRIGLRPIQGPGKKTIHIHRLVAYQFVENPNNKPVVDHLDGNKNNNHYTNLEWVTVKENNDRAVDMGLRVIKRGEDHPCNIFSESLVRRICELLEDGNGIFDIYRMIQGKDAVKTDNKGLYELIVNLRRRSVWNHITCDYEYSIEDTERKEFTNKILKDSKNTSKKLVKFICELLEKKYTASDIYMRFKGNRNIGEDIYLYNLIQLIRTRHEIFDDITKKYTWTLMDTSELQKLEEMDIYEQVYDLAMRGYSKKQIRKLFGINNPEDDISISNKISQIVDRYRTIKNTPDNQIIQIAG